MKTLFLDVDGVLVNWVAGAHQLHNIPWNVGDESPQHWPYRYGPEGWNFYKEPRFDVPLADLFKGMNRKFWASLKWMPDGPAILGLCEAYFPDNVYLLTAPCHEDGTIDGRYDWIKENLPKYRKRTLVGDCKDAIAKAGRKNAILVDDWDRNIQAWDAAGGAAITCPRPWNSEHHYADIVLQVMGTVLKEHQV
ncbi:MAG: hypothetical protein GY934_13545 [Gammaproteobacteria bacterium]|nr:hypothetical protein [Gammaproteobacteria bacterium]